MPPAMAAIAAVLSALPAGDMKSSTLSWAITARTFLTFLKILIAFLLETLRSVGLHSLKSSFGAITSLATRGCGLARGSWWRSRPSGENHASLEYVDALLLDLKWINYLGELKQISHLIEMFVVLRGMHPKSRTPVGNFYNRIRTALDQSNQRLSNNPAPNRSEPIAPALQLGLFQDVIP